VKASSKKACLSILLCPAKMIFMRKKVKAHPAWTVNLLEAALQA
jgi:hypothetical protein